MNNKVDRSVSCTILDTGFVGCISVT